MAEASKPRIGVLAGGGGTTFQVVQEAIAAGTLRAEIAFVISNNGRANPRAEIWERARGLHVPIFHISNLTQETCTVPIVGGKPVPGTISYEASARMADLAHTYDIKMLVALGFMRKLIGRVLAEIPAANGHHGPLPATAGKYGISIDEEVMRQGLDFSGPTFHWMDRRVDENGLPMYDLDEGNRDLQIGREPVPVTRTMRQEWHIRNTATLLQVEDTRVEKLRVPQWIDLALRQLDAAA